MKQFRLTYNYNGLRDSSPELLLECPTGTELVGFRLKAGNMSTVETARLFSVDYPSKPAGEESSSAPNSSLKKGKLLFHPDKLVTALTKEKVEWPLQLVFEVSLRNNGEETIYDARIEYLSKSSSFYDPDLTWNWLNEERAINLNESSSSEDTHIGTLRVGKESRSRDIAFQLQTDSEDGERVKYPLGKYIYLNDGGVENGIESMKTDGFRCVFRNVNPGSNYQLKISNKWLEDSRIKRLTVQWEGDFQQEKEFLVSLPDLSPHPVIKFLGFESMDGLPLTGDRYQLDHEKGISKLGNLKLQITDPRGQGYKIAGSLTTDGGQSESPVNLPSAGLPPGLSKVKARRELGQKNNKIAFLLQPKPEIAKSVDRPFFKQYVHTIPLGIDMLDVMFTSASPDTEFSTHISAGEGDQLTTTSLKFRVNGSGDSRIKILPEQNPFAKVEDFPINLKAVQPKASLPQFTVANTRTQKGEGFISFRLENVTLYFPVPESKKAYTLVLCDDEQDIPINPDKHTKLIATLGDKGKKALHFELRATDQLTTRSAPAEMTLSYDIAYQIHKHAAFEGDFTQGATKREFREFRLILAPVVNRNYISIDLGASAIVAAHSTSSKDGFDFDFIDLQKQLIHVRNTAGLDYDKNVQQEGGTRFLSSNVLIRNNAEIKATDPRNSLVELAPSPVNLSKDHTRWLPNIKMLFGGNGVSKLNQAFKNGIQVKVGSNRIEQIKAEDPKVIELSMHALVYSVLNHFVLPEALLHQDADNLTEIVFTVPNNFSEEYRKDIVEWTEVERSSEHAGITISFVSESDAIAYAYLDQGKQVNVAKLIDKLELILAYDIGAGTVDLSLIERSINPAKNSESILKVVGRIGLPKAGNYLDYVIAKIVWELYGAGVGKISEMIGIKDPFKTPDSPEAREFHNFIRNELKPKIGELNIDAKSRRKMYTVSDDYNLLSVSDQHKINLYSILDHPEFKAYLNQVSTKALEKLFYNAYGEGKYGAVDTIIFSGRTSQMSCLKTSLRTGLDSLPEQDTNNISEVTTDNWSMANLKLNQEKLKGIVALGGLRYLKKYRNLGKNGAAKTLRLGSRHIMSSYGMLYNKSTTGKADWQYRELVQPQFDESTEFNYQDEVDFGGANKLYIVQTFDQDATLILEGFNEGQFVGDYTVGLNGGQPIIFSEEGFAPEEIGMVSVSIKEGRSLRIKLHWKNDHTRAFTKDFPKYQVGYNIQSPTLAQSLWPYVDPQK